MPKYQNLNQKLAQLPPEYKGNLLPEIRKEFLKSGRTIVVLDDDPTGTQTCYDVKVLTSWEVDLLSSELRQMPAILFILTNSRSLTESEAVALAKEIGQNLKTAVEKSGRDIILISRSDSTLRGHFPTEVNAVAAAMDIPNVPQILIPAFIEGGRYTIDDTHYIAENEELVPVSDTPFAKDVVFGYENANLRNWVEEKSKGKIEADDVLSVSLEDIRLGGPEKVADNFKNLKSGAVCVANAASYRDLEVLAMAVILAKKPLLFRSSATFVPLLSGVESGKAFVPKAKDFASPNGSLVIVGSHVPKSTRQLNYLLKQNSHKALEVNVTKILKSGDTASEVQKFIAKANKWLTNNENVLIYTSRHLEVGHDAKSSLEINALVSAFLVGVLKGINVRPKYIITKGGITSSDLATKALAAKTALIRGAILPGVPVWQLDDTSKFPQITYVVFPGNVGNDEALVEVCEKFKGF